MTVTVTVTATVTAISRSQLRLIYQTATKIKRPSPTPVWRPFRFSLCERYYTNLIMCLSMCVKAQIRPMAVTFIEGNRNLKKYNVCIAIESLEIEEIVPGKTHTESKDVWMNYLEGLFRNRESIIPGLCLLKTNDEQ